MILQQKMRILQLKNDGFIQEPAVQPKILAVAREMFLSFLIERF